jgi:hypothetical protein
MTISDYQVGSVIKTYLKNMRIKLKEKENGLIQKPRDDEVLISQEGMKKVLYNRISKQLVERSKKYDET